MTETAQQTPSAEPAEAQPATEAPRPPFELKVGARIEYGPRTGKVVAVRGHGPQPYEVHIRWDGVKYPEWHIYVTLGRLYEQGQLKILEQGRGTLLERICAVCCPGSR